MDLEIEWSPTARLDFRDIILFIAENNLPAANQFRNKILHHIKQLPKFPASGSVVPEFRDAVVERRASSLYIKCMGIPIFLLLPYTPPTPSVD
ncbi:MAG: hypothetical protein DCC43_10855 [Candidatus Brocadia sp.]|uniref:Plasmid stabilization system protein n=1 Tax=Candidatus Brocadia fulgida TaxID=380242 RepID=A0A0M2UUW3_9BACT|nr:MAG: hypothetical protein BROFUL_01435 [Candidatus Brocadia fulgida]MCC6325879.1 type II toxin-antitoxin system RelE/ParE family toxin [Candidatus Brocadia sp.]MCE7911470.1 type II toxin-antitoxin system RelE/ParE family toxin [Candidatus Brocadia sp. AMX3]MBV6518658.1 hypothetical protein [Candidatus Brocadia fulgida]MDG5996430.1 type II toxin-antitoxin system RelE/ParE family toxin [Candidatus Brocadia sp.]